MSQDNPNVEFYAKHLAEVLAGQYAEPTTFKANPDPTDGPLQVQERITLVSHDGLEFTVSGQTCRVPVADVPGFDTHGQAYTTHMEWERLRGIARKNNITPAELTAKIDAGEEIS